MLLWSLIIVSTQILSQQESPRMPTVDWKGIYPAAITIFNEDESINYEATLKHLDMMISEGIHGLVMLGSVGENYSLTDQEKRELLKASIEHVNGRVPVLTGVAELTTRMACQFAEDSAQMGADGLMVLPALVYKADEREAMQHFRTVAKASDLPIMIYNNPPAYGVDIKPEMFLEMADEANFVAIKESSDNPRRITDIYNVCGDRYLLFSGVDDLVMETFILGAIGWISGLVNAFPAENRILWDLMQAGKWEEAVKVYRWYTPLLHLDTHPKLVQYIKMAAAACGYGNEITRAPRLEVTGNERAEVMSIINKAIENRPQG